MRSQAAAREANQLIDRRAFSWTDLFNRFEETLPADVRIVAVTPQVDTRGPHAGGRHRHFAERSRTPKPSWISSRTRARSRT